MGASGSGMANGSTHESFLLASALPWLPSVAADADVLRYVEQTTREAPVEAAPTSSAAARSPGAGVGDGDEALLPTLLLELRELRTEVREIKALLLPFCGPGLGGALETRLPTPISQALVCQGPGPDPSQPCQQLFHGGVVGEASSQWPMSFSPAEQQGRTAGAPSSTCDVMMVERPPPGLLAHGCALAVSPSSSPHPGSLFCPDPCPCPSAAVAPAACAFASAPSASAPSASAPADSASASVPPFFPLPPPPSMAPPPPPPPHQLADAATFFERPIEDYIGRELLELASGQEISLLDGPVNVGPLAANSGPPGLTLYGAEVEEQRQQPPGARGNETPDGEVDDEDLDLWLEGRLPQRASFSGTARRPDIPPLDLRWVHAPTESDAEGTEEDEEEEKEDEEKEDDDCDEADNRATGLQEQLDERDSDSDRGCDGICSHSSDADAEGGDAAGDHSSNNGNDAEGDRSGDHSSSNSNDAEGEVDGDCSSSNSNETSTSAGDAGERCD